MACLRADILEERVTGMEGNDERVRKKETWNNANDARERESERERERERESRGGVRACMHRE